MALFTFPALSSVLAAKLEAEPIRANNHSQHLSSHRRSRQSFRNHAIWQLSGFLSAPLYFFFSHILPFGLGSLCLRCAECSHVHNPDVLSLRSLKPLVNYVWGEPCISLICSYHAPGCKTWPAHAQWWVKHDLHSPLQSPQCKSLQTGKGSSGLPNHLWK